AKSYAPMPCIPDVCPSYPLLSFAFFSDPSATTELYTLSLHDALPISPHGSEMGTEHLEGPTGALRPGAELSGCVRRPPVGSGGRSEEHTSELQSRENLVCRLLLEKKKCTID